MGIKIPPNVSRETLSNMIDSVSGSEDRPTAIQRRLAKLWGMGVDREETRDEVCSYLWDVWEDDPGFYKFPQELLPKRVVPSSTQRTGGCVSSIFRGVLTGLVLMFLFACVLEPA